LDPMLRELVVPSEHVAIGAERGGTGGNRDELPPQPQPRSPLKRGEGSRLVNVKPEGWLPGLLLVRQVMKHVQQRLLVHLLVLEDSERRFGADRRRLQRRIAERALDHL